MVEIRTGVRVRVRSSREIARTLDDNGCLDGLPFMPEMLAWCGRVATVSGSAHKTCDTVNKTGGRSVEDSFHLDDLRCDGTAHGRCEAMCLFFWKGAWLEPVGPDAEDEPEPDVQNLASSLRVSVSSNGRTRYLCQATLLPTFTRPLSWWSPGQYVKDVASGNIGIVSLFRTAVLQTLRHLMRLPGYRIWRGLYNAVQGPLGGVPINHDDNGGVRPGRATPVTSLDLQPGDIVRVRPYSEIYETLDKNGKNRGMRYDIEMRPHSGRRFRVARRVNRIVDEVSGEIVEMKTPSIILDGAYCESRFSYGRLFCPRRLPQFFREVWLERVDEIPVRELSPDGGPPAHEEGLG